MSEPDDLGVKPRSGCGPRLAALVIVFFVNVPLVNVGWGRLWRIAPVLLVLGLVVDVFVVVFLVVAWRRRRGARLEP